VAVKRWPQSWRGRAKRKAGEEGEENGGERAEEKGRERGEEKAGERARGESAGGRGLAARWL